MPVAGAVYIPLTEPRLDALRPGDTMDVARATTLAQTLIHRFESLERERPGVYSDSLAFARRMASLLATGGALRRPELQALLAVGRAIPNPDCALQEGLYAISSLLRTRPIR